MTPKPPKRTAKHDAALSSAEKKLAAQAARQRKKNGEFLGSKLRKIFKGNA